MNSFLMLLALVLCAGVVMLNPSAGGPAVILCAVLAGGTVLIITRSKEDRTFLLRLFVGALLARMLIATVIFTLNLQDFFGGDAFTYDLYGNYLYKVWQGEKFYQFFVDDFTNRGESSSGWGMVYMVAAVYRLVGRNMLAVQFVNSVIGAATAPVIYLCAKHIFANRRVALIVGLFVAFYPSLVLWSSQGLKDGPIVFLLAFCMLATLKLGDKLNVKYLVLLIGALFCLLSLRFYIFYMMVAAIAGAFVIGMRAVTAGSFVRQLMIIVCMGLALTYLGVARYANSQFAVYGNLSEVNRSRSDLAASNSGFGRDTDVSTASGALSAIPVGFIYLMFAPFPWQLGSLRQSITLPEMLIWWASFPALVLGLWFSVKYRLRQISPILIFTIMLTLAYSVFQGNVGTAYRQRAQLLVFYFMFVSVGFILIKERMEDRRRQKALEKEWEKQRAAQSRRPVRQQPHSWKPKTQEPEEAREEEKVESEV